MDSWSCRIKAEQLVSAEHMESIRNSDIRVIANTLAEAQVYATLAQAAATQELMFQIQNNRGY